MKTTIEIADGIMEEARSLAAEEHTTLRALVEEGLRSVVALRKKAKRTFRLKDRSFQGRGLCSTAKGKTWEEIRAMVHAGAVE